MYLYTYVHSFPSQRLNVYSICCIAKSYLGAIYIWGFPDIGVPPNHPFLDRIFPEITNQLLGYPHDELETHYHSLSSIVNHHEPYINHILTYINHIFPSSYGGTPGSQWLEDRRTPSSVPSVSSPRLALKRWPWQGMQGFRRGTCWFSWNFWRAKLLNVGNEWKFQ